MINISFKLSKRESLFLHFKSLLKSRLLWGLLGFIFTVNFLLDLLQIFKKGIREGIGFILILIIINSLLFSTLAGILAFLLSLFISAWQLWRSKEDFETAINYNFGPENVNVHTKYGKSEYKWNLFLTVAEDKNYFYFKITNTSGMIYIPKRAFNNTSDLEKFRTLLRGKKLLI